MTRTTAQKAIVGSIKTFIHDVAAPLTYSLMFLAGCFALSGAAAGQDLPVSVSASVPQLPAALGMEVKARVMMPSYEVKTGNAGPANGDPAISPTDPHAEPAIASGTVRRVTLDEAQQLAATANNPLVRLGQLQVEAAKEHRLGVQSQYFPNISGTFYNMHINKLPGDVLTLQGPLGNTRQVATNIITQDQTAFNFSAVQPITPLFAVYQLVKIARADENIAKAKAGMSVTETASKVETNYFALLVAERELIVAEADSKKIQARWLTASNSGAPRISAEQESDMIAAEKVVALPASKVKELTASLNEMIGLPEGTTLDLVPPEPLVEDVSEKEATEKAGAVSPEVVEAEQTSIKAHAGSTISKMAYFPSVAIIGGYANQNMINVVLPRDFSYIGIMATYTVFDFGKREHGVKEASAQAEAAALGVQLTKAKVASEVKSSYLELERSRQFAQMARRMVSAATVVEASYKSDDPAVESARAKMEADMFRAELEYRQAYAKVKKLMGDK